MNMHNSFNNKQLGFPQKFGDFDIGVSNLNKLNFKKNHIE